MSTQVNNKARLYTQLVCRDHEPWWNDLLAQCFRIGGSKYVSFRVCEQVSIGVEQRRLRKGEEQFLLLVCA
jgi:hypothetical protein